MHIHNTHANPVSYKAKAKPEKLPPLFSAELCLAKHGQHTFYESHNLAIAQTTCFHFKLCLGYECPHPLR